MYPDHSPELDEDDDDKPLVRPDHACVSEDEDDEPLVQPKLKNKVGTCHAFTGTKQRGPPVGEIRLPQRNLMRQETRVSDLKKARFWAKIQMVKLSAMSSISYWMSEI